VAASEAFEVVRGKVGRGPRTGRLIAPAFAAATQTDAAELASYSSDIGLPLGWLSGVGGPSYPGSAPALQRGGDRPHRKTAPLALRESSDRRDVLVTPSRFPHRCAPSFPR
jgi:hypothetical protein